MSSKYENKIVLGNGKTMTRPSGTSDTEWNTIVEGYISRFGQLQSGVSKTTTQTTTQPKTTTTSSSPNIPEPDWIGSKTTTQTSTQPKTTTTQQSTQATTQQTTQPSTQQTTQVKTAQQSQADKEATQRALNTLNNYLNNGTIDYGTYQMFKQVVEIWNPEQQIDYANILNTFEDLKRNTIDPYFQEQIKLFTDSVIANRDYLQKGREEELGLEGQQYEKNKEALQQDLESRGMTFTGQAIKKLGDESAFSTPTSGVIPINKFGGESELQQAQKAASSSSQLRYEKNLQDLQRQAEAKLGTSGSAGLVPQVEQLGGITGSMVDEKQKAYASTLTGLYNQQLQNLQSQERQELFK